MKGILPFDDRLLPLDEWIATFVEWLVDNYRAYFQIIKWPVEQTLNGFDAGLNALPPIVVIILVALGAWKFSGVRLAIFSIVTLVVIGGGAGALFATGTLSADSTARQRLSNALGGLFGPSTEDILTHFF